MPGVVLSAPQQAFNYQPNTQQQQVVLKKPYIPPEIIRMILSLLRDDKKTLTACALVNHTFNLHVTPILYHTVSLLYSNFNSFANTINGESQRSQFIRHLDLSAFSTFGYQKSDASTQNVVTPDVLIEILRFCTMLEAFSISEHLESSITFEVLKVLMFECKNLKSLDFCGLSGKNFSSAIASLAKSMGIIKFIQDYDDNDEPRYLFQKINHVSLPHLKRLSLHECPAISEHKAILTLLANAPNLTHLDLGGCSISDLTLNFIATRTNAPQKLTHLLLAKCKNISSEAIANLVDKCENLEVLNLYGDRDIATAISEYDLDTILTSPSAKNFKSLDIGSSHITSHTLNTIQENCTSLTHLGIAKACIRNYDNLTEFLKGMPDLQYIDFTGIVCLNPLNIMYVINGLQKDHSLRVIEMSGSLSKKLAPINGWMKNDKQTRRWYYAKQERPDRVHPRKLDVAETGPERMSSNFQYYSFDV